MVPIGQRFWKELNPSLYDDIKVERLDILGLVVRRTVGSVYMSLKLLKRQVELDFYNKG